MDQIACNFSFILRLTSPGLNYQAVIIINAWRMGNSVNTRMTQKNKIIRNFRKILDGKWVHLRTKGGDEKVKAWKA